MRLLAKREGTGAGGGKRVTERGRGSGTRKAGANEASRHAAEASQAELRQAPRWGRPPRCSESQPAAPAPPSLGGRPASQCETPTAAGRWPRRPWLQGARGQRQGGRAGGGAALGGWLVGLPCPHSNQGAPARPQRALPHARATGTHACLHSLQGRGPGAASGTSLTRVALRTQHHLAIGDGHELFHHLHGKLYIISIGFPEYNSEVSDGHELFHLR